jgi:hypothetical protein
LRMPELVKAQARSLDERKSLGPRTRSDAESKPRR